MAKSFDVEGLADLEKNLVKLGAKMGVKLLGQAGRKAMKPVLDAAKEGANVKTGDLRSAMAISTRKGKGNTAININVGATKSKALKSQGGQKLAGVNQKAIAQEYGTKKQKAEPFLRPALEQNVQKVLSIFKSELTARIEKASK
jgi:HK97 gp10 family phage protein